MGRYRFLNAASIAQPTAKDIAAATELTDLAEIISANRVRGEYVFTENSGILPLFGKIVSADIVTEMLDNGNPINRLVIVTEKAGKQRCRCYGNGRDNTLPAHTLTANEVKKLSFGFCTSDGEKVTETRVDGATGEVRKTPVIYANVSAI